jgi:hypothetical protein
MDEFDNEEYWLIFREHGDAFVEIVSESKVIKLKRFDESNLITAKEISEIFRSELVWLSNWAHLVGGAMASSDKAAERVVNLINNRR